MKYVVFMSKKLKKTPISEARNLGQVSEFEFATLGVHYLEDIEAIGWQEFCVRYIEMYPNRLNLNAFTAIIGALYDQDWRTIDSYLKLKARQLIKQIKMAGFNC